MSAGQLRAESWSVAGPEGELRVSVLLPDAAEPHPFVLLLGDERPSPTHEAEEAARLAHAGFAVFLPALSATTDRDALRQLGAVLDALERRRDVDRERGAVLGFGRGGTLAFLLGCARRLAAVADVDGPVHYRELSAERPIQPLELALNLEGAFLGHFSGNAAHGSVPVPASEAARLHDRLSSAARPCDIVSASRAATGFYDRSRAGFDAACTEELWRRLLPFLRENLEVD